MLFALSLSLENISRVGNVLKCLYVACAPMVGHLSNSMIYVSKIKKIKDTMVSRRRIQPEKWSNS